jgi:hypothetical protein
MAANELRPGIGNTLKRVACDLGRPTDLGRFAVPDVEFIRRARAYESLTPITSPLAHPTATERILDFKTVGDELTGIHHLYSSFIAKSTACSKVSAAPSAQADLKVDSSNWARKEARFLS